ncbi:unnamed protein product [Protopolystoma xenopodis]|uniref:Uncharacterized protein n=1 Tax=Protopolystoma xenopodis TaxID=117903 RepID=A0A448WD40_9PLAT|nr:unnamed protein product [Protopolystoma xenopodis]
MADFSRPPVDWLYCMIHADAVSKAISFDSGASREELGDMAMTKGLGAGVTFDMTEVASAGSGNRQNVVSSLAVDCHDGAGRDRSLGFLHSSGSLPRGGGNSGGRQHCDRRKGGGVCKSIKS